MVDWKFIQYFNKFLSFLKRFQIVEKVIAWKSETLTEESIKPLATSENSFNPVVNHIDDAKIQLNLMEVVQRKKSNF